MNTKEVKLVEAELLNASNAIAHVLELVSNSSFQLGAEFQAASALVGKLRSARNSIELVFSSLKQLENILNRRNENA